MSEAEQWALARQHPNILKLNSDLASLKTSCGHVAAENLEIAEEASRAKAEYDEMLRSFNALKTAYEANLVAVQRLYKVPCT